jgi:hypothetical protein
MGHPPPSRYVGHPPSVFHSVNEIIAENKTRIYERITIPRAALVGLFSLGIRKQYKVKEWCLLIDWEEVSGVRQNTIFEFSGSIVKPW